MRTSSAFAVTLTVGLVLAGQNWQGAVSVEIAPASTAINIQHAHAVDGKLATTVLPDSGSSSDDFPTLPESILSGAIQTAHACLMAGAYLVVFPLGAIATHIGPSGRGQANIHLYCQLTGLLMIVIGFGLGCYLAVQTGINWDSAHPQLGTALIGLTAIQPFIGIIHQRLAISHKEVLLVWNIHAWYGRFLMALAMIQGGLGLQLANKYSSYPAGGLAAFLIVSLLMLSIYSIVVFRNRGRRTKRIERRIAIQKQMLLQKQKQSQPQGQAQRQAEKPQKQYKPLQSPVPTTPFYPQSPQTPATSNFSRPMTPRPITPRTPAVVSPVTPSYQRA